MESPLNYRLFVGADVAAKTVTVSWVAEQRPQTFAQTPDGWTALQHAVGQTGVSPQATFVVMEATGSYWVGLAVTLHDAGYQVSVINPAQMYNYTKSVATPLEDRCLGCGGPAPVCR